MLFVCNEKKRKNSEKVDERERERETGDKEKKKKKPTMRVNDMSGKTSRRVQSFGAETSSNILITGVLGPVMLNCPV